MIRLITFDLDNTLWDINPVILEAERAMRSWVKEHVPEAIAHLEMDRLKGVYKHLLNTEPDLKGFPTRFRKRLLYSVFKEVKLDDEQALLRSEQAFEVFYEYRNRITLFHQAEHILDTLSARYPLIALTNGNASLKLVGIDRYFKAHFSAETEGHPKPHKAMFEKALQFLDIKAKQAIHIGDHPEEDVEAARMLGFHTIWFNADGRQPAGLCQPSREIHSLDSMVSAVNSIADAVQQA